MKKLGALYLIIIMCYSLLPCEDSLAQVPRVGHDLQQISQDDNHTENCTSACACICCGQSMVNQIQAEVKVKIPLTNVERHALIPAFKILEHGKNIWQPPKS